MIHLIDGFELFAFVFAGLYVEQDFPLFSVWGSFESVGRRGIQLFNRITLERKPDRKVKLWNYEDEEEGAFISITGSPLKENLTEK